jgi:hypothetical protein
MGLDGGESMGGGSGEVEQHELRDGNWGCLEAWRVGRGCCCVSEAEVISIECWRVELCQGMG